jgi:hypothetical protein
MPHHQWTTLQYQWTWEEPDRKTTGEHEEEEMQEVNGEEELT